MLNFLSISTFTSICFLIGCATSQPKPLTDQQIERICQKKKMEASALPKIKALFGKTEIYVADAHSLTLAYGVTFLESGSGDVLNQDTIDLMSEIGVMRTKACSVREGIINYATRTNVELTPTNVAVGTSVLAPKKKKKEDNKRTRLFFIGVNGLIIFI